VLNTERRVEDKKYERLLVDIFDPVKMEVRDNKNRLIKLHGLLSARRGHSDTWDYAEAIAASIQDTSYKLLLDNGLAPYLPSTISKTLYIAYSSLEGVKNMVREGKPGTRYYAGIKQDQETADNFIANTQKYTWTTKNYLDYAMQKLWDYKPGKPQGPTVEYDSLPFSASLKRFINDHPEFEATLNAWQSTEQNILPVILLTSIAEQPDEQIIGVFRYNEESRNDKSKPIFIQDYIVHDLEDDYVLYSDAPGRTEPSVKSIDEFSADYGMGKYYGTDKGKLDHFYFSVDELPEQLRAAASKRLDG
jgi:hypothetical protein